MGSLLLTVVVGGFLPGTASAVPSTTTTVPEGGAPAGTTPPTTAPPSTSTTAAPTTAPPATPPSTTTQTTSPTTSAPANPTTPTTISPAGPNDTTAPSANGAPTISGPPPGHVAPLVVPPGQDTATSFPDLASSLPPADQEVVSLRTRDEKHFRRPNGVEVAVFADKLHYQAGPGDWQDVDLRFRPSGADYVMDHNDVAVTASPSGISVTERSTGKGIRWAGGQRTDVVGQVAHFGDGGLDWQSATTAQGIKATATVSIPRGPHRYEFAYELLGPSPQALSINEAGDVVGDGFVVPRATVTGANGAKGQPGPWQLLAGAIVGFDYDDTALAPDAYPCVIDPTTTFNLPSPPGADDAGWVAGIASTYPPPSASAWVTSSNFR